MTWIHAIWSDRVSRLGVLLALVVLVVHAALLLWVLPAGPEARVLHYNIYFGADLYGPGYALWINLALSFLVLVLNSVIAAVTLERQVVAARLAIWAAALFSLIVLAGTLLLALGTR